MHKPMTSRTAIGLVLGAIAALGVVALLTVVLTGYRRDIGRAWERISEGSRIFQTTHGPIEYAVAGEGPPVLVVHGAGGGYDQGMDFAAPLLESGHQLIAVSRFGYLRTPVPPDASPVAQADAYTELLDALRVGRVAVVGLSAGGPSSMQFALRYPDRTAALVLLAPAAYPSHQEKRTGGAIPSGGKAAAKLVFDAALRSDFLFWAAPRLAPRAMFPLLLGTLPGVISGAGPAERARADLVRDGLLPFSQRRLGVMNDAAITPFLPRYDLEKIKAPALILNAADDVYGTWDGARYSAEHIPGARFVGYPTGGHLLIGHMEDAVSRITDFLKAQPWS
jgi:2-hydroxy-6-oxonona-2,4-dienedioate hydrolase